MKMSRIAQCRSESLSSSCYELTTQCEDPCPNQSPPKYTNLCPQQPQITSSFESNTHNLYVCPLANNPDSDLTTQCEGPSSGSPSLKNANLCPQQPHPTRLCIMNEKPLSVFYQNVRGLRTKSSEFYIASSSCNYDVIALSETWLNESHLDSEFFSNDFVVFRCDRNYSSMDMTRGGGVLLAIRSNIKCKELTQTTPDLEIVSVEMRYAGQTVIVVVLYIRPNQPNVFPIPVSDIITNGGPPRQVHHLWRL